MKEQRLFYAPELLVSDELPSEEATHVTRILRMHEGDHIWLTDGQGHLADAALTSCAGKRCHFRTEQVRDVERTWTPRFHLAMAPTKHNDRTEWMVEKATEIGIDQFTFLRCDFSERRDLRTDRIERIAVAAMKQSHKAWLPKVVGMMDFKQFIQEDFDGGKFIAHCYAPADVGGSDDIKPLLQQVARPGGNALVCIGPEGDFSINEVRMAIAAGFIPVSLGASRLRTETAALVALQTLHFLSTSLELQKTLHE